MPSVITAEQKLPVTVFVTDKYSNPATLDGLLTWESTNPDLLTVTVLDDATSAELIPVGPAGLVQVIVRGDADLGDGIRPITGLIDIEIIGGEASLMTITPGLAVPKE